MGQKETKNALKWPPPQGTFLRPKQRLAMGFRRKQQEYLYKKVCETMKSSGDFPMKGIVNVDEYVIGDYQKGKPEVTIVQRKKQYVRWN